MSEIAIASLSAMKTKSILYAIMSLLLSIFWAESAAKNPYYYFRTLDIKDGLSHNTVNTILQDRQGFMWFGTKDGLNQYDGLVFRTFQKENSSLGNNFITALHEDAEGNIWVGTDTGVYIYNPRLEKFTPFDIPIEGTGETISRTITWIDSDPQKDVWISSDSQGLFHYDIKKNSLKEYSAKIGKGALNITRFWFGDNELWVEPLRGQPVSFGRRRPLHRFPGCRRRRAFQRSYHHHLCQRTAQLHLYRFVQRPGRNQPDHPQGAPPVKRLRTQHLPAFGYGAMGRYGTRHLHLQLGNRQIYPPHHLGVRRPLRIIRQRHLHHLQRP